MQIPVLVERVKGNGYRARGTGPFAVSAKGASRQEALAKLRAKIQSRLKTGTELVGLEIGASTDDPWMEFAGMFKDDPWIADWKQSVEEYRQKVDDDPEALLSLYVLDTDTLQLFQDEHALVVARVRAVPPDDRAISIVTVEEQLSGWYTQLRKAKRPERLAWAYRRLAATVRFLTRIQIIDFDEAAIQRCAQLKKHKVKVGTMDLRIAATVLERDAILVTRNVRDFRSVPGLHIEDWSK